MRLSHPIVPITLLQEVEVIPLDRLITREMNVRYVSPTTLGHSQEHFRDT